MPHDQVAAYFWLKRRRDRGAAERDVLQGAVNAAAAGVSEMLA